MISVGENTMNRKGILLSVWVIIDKCQMTNFPAISWREQVTGTF